MMLPRRLWSDLANLSAGRLILWCYFIWYLVVLVRYFDLSWQLWLTAVGLSLIIGTALLINTTLSGKTRVKLEGWPAFRLFVTPFCVSSFSMLIKGRGFILIFSSNRYELLAAAGLITAFCLTTWMAKRTARNHPTIVNSQATTHNGSPTTDH